MQVTSKRSKFEGDRYIPVSRRCLENKENIMRDQGEEKEIRYKQVFINDQLCGQLLYTSCQDYSGQKTLKYITKKSRKNLEDNSLLTKMYSLYSKVPYQRTESLRWVEIAHFHSNQISSTPEKILDAPDIVDDFYLNILDWGSNNQLAIGLSNNLYIWNAFNGHIEQLMGDKLHSESVSLITAVHWMNDEILSIGFDNGLIKLIDVQQQSIINTLSYHMSRINAINSTWDLLSSAGRDYQIINHDPRERNHNIVSVFERHTQEVCGLKWQSTTNTLASGANDNMVLLWDKRQMRLRQNCQGHCAAVKAMAWCPWQQNGLATGGGSNDRTIRFWNTDTGACTKVIETASQVCALQFLPKYKEMISSHGFSKYEIALWKADNLCKQPLKVQELSGHQSRVLHLGLSPDRTNLFSQLFSESLLCSAAGDETLRFWRVGQDVKTKDSPEKGLRDGLKHLNLR